MRTRVPAFRFYPGDFLNDAFVRAMPANARGVYITLLCVEWIEGHLPDDLDQLARLAAVSRAEFRKVWPFVEPCFERRAGGGLYQKRLEAERQKQAAYRERMSARGALGAERRWGSH